MRSLLARVARLEQAETSPLVRLFGSIEEVDARIQAGVAEGLYDPRDIAVVSAAVKRWIGRGACDHVLSCG